MRRRLRLLGIAGVSVMVSGFAIAQGVSVRIMPPNKAQFLQNQKFDIRVEATASTAGGAVDSLVVSIDGKDVTSTGTTSAPSADVLNWTLRQTSYSAAGFRVINAKATGHSSGGATSGSASAAIRVRDWMSASHALGAHRIEQAHPVEVVGGPSSATLAAATPADVEDVMNNLHLGAISPLFHKQADAAILAGTPQRRAKNVILLIGDGMGVAHRTAGRVLGKGYTQGKANGTMNMDRFPYNGLLMTSSMNSLITDSAPGAHNYSTGNKTNNGMEGVFPDNTAAEDDNPRIENLSEFTWRNFGMVTGIVSDAFLTDATPAAFLAHTQNRGNGMLVASQYVDAIDNAGLKVLMGGGSYHFIPKSQAGSRRTDERNIITEFQGKGFTFVDNATALNAYVPGVNAQLLGLYNLDNMNVAFDKLKMGDASVTASFPDQPFLKDMAAKAIEVLRQYPNGFFLMVEGAHIDKQSHRMDADRAIYEVIQFDQAVGAALAFAAETNSDNDPDNDTLVIVSADHECSGLALPGVGRPEKRGSRDFVKTYNYSAPRNDSTVFNFTDYTIGPNGYPTNPDTPHRLIVNFGAAPDHWEDWTPGSRPRNASATEGSGVDPNVVVGGIATANSADPKKNSPGAFLVTGVIENGSNGGDVETQAVHTLTDIPISAFGPGSSQFARVSDNTEAYFYIMNAILGLYPTPTQF